MERRPRTRTADRSAVVWVAAVVWALGLLRAFVGPPGWVGDGLRLVLWLAALGWVAWSVKGRPVWSGALGAALGVLAVFVTLGVTWRWFVMQDTELARRFADAAQEDVPWGVLLVVGPVAAVVTGALSALVVWSLVRGRQARRQASSPPPDEAS